jgi:hypothetical protein
VVEPMLTHNLMFMDWCRTWDDHVRVTLSTNIYSAMPFPIMIATTPYDGTEGPYR